MSEIRVNRVVNAEGSNAPSFPYGFELPAGIGITGSGGVNVGGPSTIASSGGITTCGGDLFAGDSLGVLKDIKIGAAATITGALSAGSVASSGAVSGTTGTFSGAVNVDATTESTSITSGALIVDGGAGVAKNLFVGDAIDVTKDLKVGAAATITGAASIAGAVSITNNTSSTSTSSGALVVTGGVGVAGDIFVGAGLSVAGTLTYEDVSNVDSVGVVTAGKGVDVTAGGVDITAGGLVVTAGVTTIAGTSTFAKKTTVNATLEASEGLNVTAGIATLQALTGPTGTLTGNLTLDNGADAGKDLTWNTSSDALIFNDDVYAHFGSGSDLKIYHNGSHSLIEQSGTGNLYIRPKTGEDGITLVADGAVTLSHDNSNRIATTNEGVNVSGMMSSTAGIGITGGMFEGARIVADKLSNTVHINLAEGNIWHFTTTETATHTPNIRWNSTYSLANKVRAGSVITLTVITTAAAAAYSANWTVDGSAVTEEWNGGAAPSEGGASGYDVYTLTLVHKPGGSWLVLGNLSNFA